MEVGSSPFAGLAPLAPPSSEAAAHERRSSLWAHRHALLLLPLFFLGFNWVHGIAGTQVTYLPPGLRLAGEPGFAHDWFANTTPTHPLFCALGALWAYLGILQPACYVASALLYSLGLAAAYLQALWLYDCWRARGFGTRVERERFALLAVLAVMLVFYLRRSAITLLGWPLRSAFAYQQFSEVFDPNQFALLIYFGLALLPFGRYRAASVCLGVAAAFQEGYLLHAGAALLLGGAWLARQGRVRDAAALIVPFALLVTPFVAYASWLKLIAHTPASTALGLLARERIAHHVFPRVWWPGSGSRGRSALLVLAALVLLRTARGMFSWVFAGSVAYVLLGIAVAYLTRSASIGLLFPWRASTYLVPAATVVLSTAALYGALRLVEARWNGSARALVTALGVPLLLACSAAELLQLVYRRDEREDPPGLVDFAVAVHGATTPRDVLLIPPDWMRFRVLSRRAIYIDQKNHPFQPDQVMEWFRRLKNAEAFYRLPEDARSRACAELGATFYAENPGTAPGTRAAALRVGGYRLQRCAF